MTTEQMREMEIWIAENVFCWHDITENPFSPNPRLCGFNNSQGKTIESNGGSKWGIPNYTTDPVAAMEVLKKCSEKDSHEYMGGYVVEVWKHDYGWSVAARISRDSSFPIPNDMRTDAKTLELAICLFAKKLFTK